MTFQENRGEILNINKPAGWTSFDVVKKIRNTTREKKVGHAGTLDPFATGVLLICTGGATKKVSHLMKLDKEYLAEIELGKTTDTYDPTGIFLTHNSIGDFNIEQIERICQKFRGEIWQVPPMFSALKIGGERLYKKARRGEVVEREPRKITIYELEIMEYCRPFLNLRIVCSKGSYIRSIANDIGKELGCGAYLKTLQRTRIGNFTIEDANDLPDFVQHFQTSTVMM